MSQFVGAAQNVIINAANDISNCDQIYWSTRSRYPGSVWAQELRNRADNANDQYIFQTRWWPRHGNLIGGWYGTADDGFLNQTCRWCPPRTERGANGRFAFVGYTRDQYGSPLGNCTVRCYRASTEELVSKVTSDANGLYFATSPYNDAHFLVIHAPGGNLAGATKDSLTPA